MVVYLLGQRKSIFDTGGIVMRLSDAIEDFIKALMQSEEQQECEL